MIHPSNNNNQYINIFQIQFNDIKFMNGLIETRLANIFEELEILREYIFNSINLPIKINI